MAAGRSIPATQRVVFLVGPERVELREVAVEPPGPGELLVRIGAATTCGTDVKVFRRGGHPRMLVVPTPFGHEMAGTVIAVGSGAAIERPFREGDRVVVSNSAPCGDCERCRRGRENLCPDLRYLNGAFAELIRVPERFARRSTHLLPEGLPFERAALTEPLACVLHGLEACRLDGPSDVVVYGGGPIGLLFTAVLAGEGHRVVMADPNPGRLEAARALGAADGVRVERGGGQWEAVRARASRKDGFEAAIEATGTPQAWEDAVLSVRAGGTVNLFGGCAPGTKVSLDTHLVHYSELTILGVYHHRPATVARALELLARNTFDASIILDAERPLEDLEGALRAMMEKRALKVVIHP